MAMQSFQLDPTAVVQTTFDAHAHNYRKVTQVSGDSAKAWATPVRTDIIDDQENYVYDNQDLEGVGVTVALSPTGTPV